MATLKAHGGSIAKIDYGAYKISVQADGAVLINMGFGWKAYRRVKEGVDLGEYIKKRKAGVKTKMVKALKNISGNLKTRAKAYTLAQLMPDDPDGVWAELNDFDNTIAFEDVAELCELLK